MSIQVFCATAKNKTKIRISMYLTTVLCVITFVLLSKANGQADDCDNDLSECKELQFCPDITSHLATIKLDSLRFCNKPMGIVCCPRPETIVDIRLGDTEITTSAEKACFEYQKLAPRYCPQALIYGGEKAAPKEFQSIALVGAKDKSNGKVNWYCGGTLISRRFVVTAAHCFRRNINFVRLGELDHSTTGDATQTQNFDVRNAVVHPTHNLERYNDIALIELDHDVIFNEYVLPACLPPKDTEYKSFTAVGWGETENKTSSSHLLKVHLNLFDGDECAASVTAQEELEMGIRKRTQICAGSHQSGYDTCNGDSGGPLYVPHPSYPCMLLLSAVTSFGYVNCGTAGIPSINTKVNLYLDWIENVVWNSTTSL
ncbi:CLIP domain-containing serine protease B4-like [Eurosta solidaginis]|uniref:CLIP domain-containing serine protease B4-like n=1 Tax=Eurosta solidaginis TaxID=178769 RepID=UPI0035314CEC